MTVNEKRVIVERYCDSKDCRYCELTRDDWKNWVADSSVGKCIHIAKATEEELDRAIAIIEGREIAADPGNPYWDRITAVANRQRSKGLKEYGKGVEDDTADINVRLDRIEEELIDALMYLEHLRDGIARIKEVVG